MGRVHPVQARLSLANAQTALETARINLETNRDSAAQSNVRLSYQVDAAQASYNSAKKVYESQKALFDLGGISAAALDTAQSNLTAASANLENAKTALDMNKRGISTTQSQNIEALKVAVSTAENNVKIAELALRNTQVKAPFAGQLSVVAANPGMYLSLNTAAFTIVAFQRQISFSVPPADAPALPAGSVVSYDAGGSTYRLRTSQSPAAPVNGLVPLSAPLPRNFPLPLGSVGTVRYPVGLAYGTLVPVSALGSLESKNFVFVVEKGAAVRRNVEILAESDASAAVSGIESGADVIATAPPGLVAGSPVQAIAAPEAPVPGRNAARGAGNWSGASGQAQAQSQGRTGQ